MILALLSDIHGNCVALEQVVTDARAQCVGVTPDAPDDAVIDTVRRSMHPARDYIAGFQSGAQVRYPAET